MRGNKKMRGGDVDATAPGLEDAVLKRLAVAPASLRLLRRNCAGDVQKYVFAARLTSSRERCALKLFVHAPDDLRARHQVEKETQTAQWASQQQQLGVPVHCVVQTPQATVMVMALAAADFEAVLRRGHRLPYATVKELFAQAFRLAAHDELVARGLVCADLKPANFLVHAWPGPRTCTAFDLAATVKLGGDARKQGRDLELRLADFDPHFWSHAAADDVARLNGFFLLANCVLWKTACRLGPYLPAAALELAAAVRARELSLLRLLARHRRLLLRGPMHYAGMAGEGVLSAEALEAFLQKLSVALAKHGV